jgi:hypothetical protein
MTLAFFRGLERAPTFLVPIINPPFADNSPHLTPGVKGFSAQAISREKNHGQRRLPVRTIPKSF